MKTSNLLFLISLFILITGCVKDDPVIDFKCEDNQDVCDLAKSNNDFGYDIFKKLHEEDPESNLFISPFSISTAFGMLLNGARTETREEILEVMKLNGWTETDMNDAFKALLEILPALDNKVKLNLANSIWYREGYNVLEDFLQRNSEHFGSEIREMDFSDPETKDIINGWIEDQTNGKIKDMIDQIKPTTVMFLINAIYFYGEWTYEFDKDNTKTGFFYPDYGQAVECEMMKMGEVTLPYYKAENYQLLDLPYGDSIFTMTILLPDSDYNVDKVIGEMDPVILEGQFEAMQETEITQVSIPKFKIEYKKKLVETLISLGMERVFDPARADLSGINGYGDLFVSDVIHQSFIEVDEKGTEAAAATVIVVIETSAGNEIYFDANRSFVFFIRDNRTNSILFSGKLITPTEE
jgi:serpin B